MKTKNYIFGYPRNRNIKLAKNIFENFKLILDLN